MGNKARRKALWLLLACFAIVGCGERDRRNEPETSRPISPASELLERFKRGHPAMEVIKWTEADLNSDGRSDLIVMYRVDEDKNMMRVVLDLTEGLLATNEVPAPHSDQVIQLRDIDRKPPLEFIVQGTKGSKMGFAVFRVEGNRLVDLFGEGMEDCC